MVAIDLSHNQLQGQPFAILAKLTKLTYLALSNNELTGPLSPALGNLTHLHGLHLANNAFTGNVPLIQLSKLEKLSTYFSLVEINLTALCIVSSNNMSRLIHSFLLAGLPETFRAENNILSGTLDTAITDFRSIGKFPIIQVFFQTDQHHSLVLL